MDLDIPTIIQVGTVIFSAGAAYGSLKMVGQKVDALSQRMDASLSALAERVNLALGAQRKDIDALDTEGRDASKTLGQHGERISVLEQRAGSFDRFRAVVAGRGSRPDLSGEGE